MSLSHLSSSLESSQMIFQLLDEMNGWILQQFEKESGFVLYLEGDSEEAA